MPLAPFRFLPLLQRNFKVRDVAERALGHLLLARSGPEAMAVMLHRLTKVLGSVDVTAAKDTLRLKVSKLDWDDEE